MGNIYIYICLFDGESIYIWLMENNRGRKEGRNEEKKETRRETEAEGRGTDGCKEIITLKKKPRAIMLHTEQEHVMNRNKGISVVTFSSQGLL